MPRGVYERTPEARANLSAAQTRRWEKIRAGEIPAPPNADGELTRRYWARVHAGELPWPEGIGSGRRGKRNTPEHTEKIRQGLLRYYEAHPEARTRIGDRQRGQVRKQQASE